jgi:hypothetical protein
MHTAGRVHLQRALVEHEKRGVVNDEVKRERFGGATL